MRPPRSKKEFARLTVLLDGARKQAFDAACAARGSNASEVLRALIEAFLREGGVDHADDAARDTDSGARPVRLTILIPPATKADFEAACRADDLTPSQVVRRLIRRPPNRAA